MIVVDASAVLEVLLRTATGQAVEVMLLQRGETLHAPYLIDLEVTQVLRRYALSKQVSQRRCAEALEDWRAFRMHRYAHEPLLERVWALRENLTAYDAAYVALAEALEAPLLTCDARLATAPGHGARIDLV